MLRDKRCYSDIVCEYSQLVYDEFLRKVYGINSCANDQLYENKEDYKLELAIKSSGLLSVAELEESGIKVRDLENVRGYGNLYNVSNNTYITNNYTTTINEYTATGYVHNQVVASSVWTIIHGLGFCPNVTVIDTTGQEIKGQVNYNSDCSVVTITFNSAIAGKAYLS